MPFLSGTVYFMRKEGNFPKSIVSNFHGYPMGINIIEKRLKETFRKGHQNMSFGSNLAVNQIVLNLPLRFSSKKSKQTVGDLNIEGHSHQFQDKYQTLVFHAL